MSANDRIRFVLKIVFVSLCITPSHYHLCANLSWRHWTYKVPQIYSVECVSKIRHILSVIHYTIRGAVCFQFTYCHHQIGSMNYYPLFRVRSWNNAVYTVCISVFLCKQNAALTKHLPFTVFIMYESSDPGTGPAFYLWLDKVIIVSMDFQSRPINVFFIFYSSFKCYQRQEYTFLLPLTLNILKLRCWLHFTTVCFLFAIELRRQFHVLMI